MGNYEMRLSRQGYGTASGTFTILRSGSFTTTLDPLERTGAADPGRMVGRVTDGESGRPLQGVRVRIAEIRLEALTDQNGRFVLGEVPPGAHEVEFSNLGFAPRTDTLEVVAGLTTDARVVLAVDPVELEPMEVRVERREVGLEAAGFYLRRAYASGGTFLDREAIEAQNPVEMVDVFSRVPGAEARLADPLDALSRSVILRGGRRDSPPCYPAVYVDGMVVHRAGPAPAMLNQILSPDQVAGIEIYQGGASAPLEYGGTNASCGVLVIWTRK